MTPEQCARVILSPFEGDNIQAGHVLMADAVHSRSLQAGLTAAEYMSGLQYAGDHDWFESPDNRTLKLTAAGFAELHK